MEKNGGKENLFAKLGASGPTFLPCNAGSAGNTFRNTDKLVLMPGYHQIVAHNVKFVFFFLRVISKFRPFTFRMFRAFSNVSSSEKAYI